MNHSSMRSRASTAKVEETGDLEGYADLSDSQKSLVRDKIKDFTKAYAAKASSSSPKKAKTAAATSTGDAKQATLSFRGTIEKPKAAAAAAAAARSGSPTASEDAASDAEAAGAATGASAPDTSHCMIVEDLHMIL